MKRVLLFFVLFFVGAATAQTSMVFKHHLSSGGGPVVLRIYFDICSHAPALAYITPPYRQMFKRSVLTWQGKDWESCWVERDGHVLSVDEEGALFNRPVGVPLTMFKDDSV